MPPVVALGFNFISPFSIFKRIAIVSTVVGSMANFNFNLRDDLEDLAKNDKTSIGD